GVEEAAQATTLESTFGKSTTPTPLRPGASPEKLRYEDTHHRWTFWLDDDVRERLTAYGARRRDAGDRKWTNNYTVEQAFLDFLAISAQHEALEAAAAAEGIPRHELLARLVRDGLAGA